MDSWLHHPTCYWDGLSQHGTVYSASCRGGSVYLLAYTPPVHRLRVREAGGNGGFGVRSTGEPRETRIVECDAAPYFQEVTFPSGRPLVMLADGTFWEEATGFHVFCSQKRSRGERLSRHSHDLVRLDYARYAKEASSDREIGFPVTRHKSRNLKVGEHPPKVIYVSPS